MRAQQATLCGWALGHFQPQRAPKFAVRPSSLGLGSWCPAVLAANFTGGHERRNQPPQLEHQVQQGGQKVDVWDQASGPFDLVKYVEPSASPTADAYRQDFS